MSDLVPPTPGPKGSMLARYAGIAGAAVGVLAAGAAAGVLAERRVVARRRDGSDESFGSVHSPGISVAADDDLRLHVEVDELASTPPDGRMSRREWERRQTSPRATMVFVHGYALNLDSWHFQRLAFRGERRMVLFDQRSHGRSGRSRREHSTIDQTGRDLAAVIGAVAPDEPVVLIGHSMGGMTIMALAEQHPDWFGSKVVGVALVSTSPGQLRASTLGLPGRAGRLVQLVSPAVLATLARAPRLVESGRRVGSDLGFVLTRTMAFGGPVPQEYVDFTDEMLSATPVDVIADFFPGFDLHDKYQALAAVGEVPTVVIAGANDHITPLDHGRRIAEAITSARLIEYDDAGHMIVLERHDDVTRELRDLVERADAATPGGKRMR